MLFLTRQASQAANQEQGIVGSQSTAGSDCPRGGHDLFDPGKPTLLADWQPESPAAEADDDVGVGLTDAHFAAALEIPAGEQGTGRDQEVFLPGERKTRLEEQLAAIGGGDLATP